MAGIAAELGWPRGTPAFGETVHYDARSAGLLRAAHVAAEHGDALASSSLLHSALAWLLAAYASPARPRSRPGRSGRAPVAVRLAQDLLASCLTEPPSLDQLATATGLSAFALLRAFRRQTGLPPHAYLNQQRVRLARSLLDQGVPPAGVAAAAGFTDQAHLTRHFKRVVGVPPGAYQRGRPPAAAGGGYRPGKNVQAS